MDFLFGRYRNLTILVGVLFLQVLGLAVQVKRSGDAENTRLIRIWAVDTITPFERALVWAQNGTGNLWHNYIFLRGVRAQNRELKKQIDQLHLEQVRLSEDAEQAHRLQQLLSFREQIIAKTVPAQVIGSSGSDLSRSIYIDKGSNDGIATDMAVITTSGIVGKVLRVYPSTSLVLMINDQTSGVGAMIEKSRLQGVLKGTPDGAVILERVMSDEQVAPGDTLISSGGDQIFPKGLPVGTVTKVSPGREMFWKIEVKPAADLSRLEEVLVITEKQEQNAVVDNAGHGRAADILAQRLPSVPDRPVLSAVPGTALPAAAANESRSTESRPAGPRVAGSTTATAARPGESVTAPSTGRAETKTPSPASPAVHPPAKPASGDLALKPNSKPDSTTNSTLNPKTAPIGGSSVQAGPTTIPAPAKPATLPQKLRIAQPAPQPPSTEEESH
jgi:rod shape-determining protein MreC